MKDISPVRCPCADTARTGLSADHAGLAAVASHSSACLYCVKIRLSSHRGEWRRSRAVCHCGPGFYIGRGSHSEAGARIFFCTTEGRNHRGCGDILLPGLPGTDGLARNAASATFTRGLDRRADLQTGGAQTGARHRSGQGRRHLLAYSARRRTPLPHRRSAGPARAKRCRPGFSLHRYARCSGTPHTLLTSPMWPLLSPFPALSPAEKKTSRYRSLAEGTCGCRPWTGRGSQSRSARLSVPRCPTG